MLGLRYSGFPVGRSSFVTLSMAEAELMAMLEGLTALRSVNAIVQMVNQAEVEGRTYSDSI